MMIKTDTDFKEAATSAVTIFYNKTEHEPIDGYIYDSITEDNIHVVWQCKALQNWKATLITDVPDNIYYEFTWDGDKCQGYLDIYKKVGKTAVVIDEDSDLHKEMMKND